MGRAPLEWAGNSLSITKAIGHLATDEMANAQPKKLDIIARSETLTNAIRDIINSPTVVQFTIGVTGALEFAAIKL